MDHRSVGESETIEELLSVLSFMPFSQFVFQVHPCLLVYLMNVQSNWRKKHLRHEFPFYTFSPNATSAAALVARLIPYIRFHFHSFYFMSIFFCVLCIYIGLWRTGLEDTILQGCDFNRDGKINRKELTMILLALSKSSPDA